MPHLLLVALFFVGLLVAAFSLARIALDIRRNADDDRSLADMLVAKGALHDDVRLYVLLHMQCRDLDRTRSEVLKRVDALWWAFTEEQRELALRQLEQMDAFPNLTMPQEANARGAR